MSKARRIQKTSRGYGAPIAWLCYFLAVVLAIAGWWFGHLLEFTIGLAVLTLLALVILTIGIAKYRNRIEDELLESQRKFQQQNRKSVRRNAEVVQALKSRIDELSRENLQLQQAKTLADRSVLELRNDAASLRVELKLLRNELARVAPDSPILRPKSVSDSTMDLADVTCYIPKIVDFSEATKGFRFADIRSENP